MAQHEVSARMALAAIDLAKEIQVPVAQVLDGLPYDERGIRKVKRVTWDDYCTIIERITEAAGGASELEDLLASSYHRVIPQVRILYGAIVSPRLALRLVWEVFDPMLFPPVAFTFEELGDDRVRLGAFMRPGIRGCEPFFVGTTGSIRGFPRHFGNAELEILSRDVAGDHGVWDVRIPETTLVRRVRERAKLALRIALGADFAVTASVGDVELDPVSTRLAAAIETWKLSPRQGAVLEHIAKGLANKAIANELACADNTIELHVTRLLRKAGVTSRSELIARFWSEFH